MDGDITTRETKPLTNGTFAREGSGVTIRCIHVKAKGGEGVKIEIAKATCDDEKGIRSLTALLETKDSWTVNSLYLKTFSINVDCDFAALSDYCLDRTRPKPSRA